MKGIIAVALMSLSFAPFSTFTEAFEMSQNYGNAVSQKDIPMVYNWIQARNNNLRWHDGFAMKKTEVDELMAMPFPI